MIESLKKINIIYAEDENDIRKTFSNILSLVFNDVHAVTNGQEALDLFNELSNKDDYKISMIISDITMPKMTGYELLKNLRESGNDIPFIITTAHGDLKTITKIKEYEISDYITKPVDLQKLILKCNEVLK